jgi:hypothetical protein
MSTLQIINIQNHWPFCLFRTPPNNKKSLTVLTMLMYRHRVACSSFQLEFAPALVWAEIPYSELKPRLIWADLDHTWCLHCLSLNTLKCTRKKKFSLLTRQDIHPQSMSDNYFGAGKWIHVVLQIWNFKDQKLFIHISLLHVTPCSKHFRETCYGQLHAHPEERSNVFLLNATNHPE